MPTLNWLNDDEARKTSAHIPYRLLEADASLSFGTAETENMLIQGDNLEALKALLPYYAGQVKCIYIDPPYNTQSAFEHYDDNLEHATWLSMIYPRLEMLRDLLAEDGSIWVSIDDTEGHYLKVLMDEVFGRINFVGHIVWQKTYTRENRTDVATVHDTILLYAKNRSVWKDIRNSLPTSDSQLDRYSNPDNDVRGLWASLPAHAKAEKGRRQAQFFTITTPSGRKIDPPAGRCWLYTEPRFAEMVADNRIWFGEDGKNAPRVKKFFSEVQAGLVPSSLWLYSEVGTTGTAKAEITTLFPGTVPFSTPKPEALLNRIIHISSNPGDLVLDSFLGSGTTVAVAHKMGRRYIGIEMGAHAVTHCVPRLQKVIEGEQGGISKEVNWLGGGGFRFYRLGEAIFDEDGRINPQVKFHSLAAHVWFSETKTPLQLPPFSNTENRGSEGGTPLIGIQNGIAYYLLYNGILGEKSLQGGNVLTGSILAGLPPFDGPKIIYGEMTTFGAQRLAREKIVFKQVPYDIKAR
jgi:adenine-specific DNA-methyltransferase